MMDQGFKDTTEVLSRWYDQLKEFECKNNKEACDKSKEEWEKDYIEKREKELLKIRGEMKPER